MTCKVGASAGVLCVQSLETKIGRALPDKNLEIL